MTTTTTLKTLLQPLLATLKIDGCKLEDARSYVFKVTSRLSLQLEENPERYLTISCAIKMPDVRKEDLYTAWMLLQTNLLGLEHPPILTAALAEEKTLIVWARHNFNELDASVLNQLFERFIERAEQIDDWLNSPLTDKIQAQATFRMEKNTYGDAIKQKLNAQFND